jgi:predicted RNase H-like HicB family nuclease
MKRYTVVLLPDIEEGGFTVAVPALPGCVTEGETYEEALANAREAIELHIECLSTDGDEVPIEEAPPAIAFVEIP